MASIKVKWQVSDGYVMNGPHSFQLDLDDMVESCENEQQAREYLEAEVQMDFEGKATYSINNEDDVIAAWRNARDEQAGAK